MGTAFGNPVRPSEYALKDRLANATKNRDEVERIVKTSRLGLQRQTAKAVLASIPDTLLISNLCPEVESLLADAVLRLKELQGNDLDDLYSKLEQNRTSVLFSEFNWASFLAAKAVYGRLETPEALPPRFDDILRSVVTQRGVLYKQLIGIQVAFSEWLDVFKESKRVFLEKINGLLETCKKLVGEVQASQTEISCEKKEGGKRLEEGFLALLKDFQKIISEQSVRLHGPSSSLQLLELARQQLDMVNVKIHQVNLSLEGFREALLLLQFTVQQVAVKDLGEVANILKVPLPPWWEDAAKVYSKNLSGKIPENSEELKWAIREFGTHIEDWRKDLVQVMKRRWSSCAKKIEKRARAAQLTIEGGVQLFRGCSPGEELFWARELDRLNKKATDLTQRSHPVH